MRLKTGDMRLLPCASFVNLVALSLLSLCLVVSAGAQTSTPVRIMCVGDSITAGYTDTNWVTPFEFGYRSGLYTRLKNSGYPFQFVGESTEPWSTVLGSLITNTPVVDLRTVDQDHHRGYAGWGTSGILFYIGGWLSTDNPDVVLLMIGINDDGGIPAQSNLNSIVQTIVTTKPDAQLIVAQITPMANYDTNIVNYNAYIRDTLVPSYQAQGKHVSTVDQYTNLMTDGQIDPSLFANGFNHPGLIAYDRIAQTWFDGLLTLPFDAGSHGGAGMVQFSSATFNAGKMDGSATISLTRTNGISGPFTVNYATADGTAVDGTDYIATSGTVTFTASTSQSFTIPVLNDGMPGPGKTVNITLFNPSGGAMLGTPSIAVLKIFNDYGRCRAKVGFTGYDNAERLTNFPALVVLSTNIPGFSYTQFTSTNGYDLNFTSSDGLQELNYEMGQWNTNGNSYVWVQIPEFSSNCYIWASWSNTAYDAISAAAACATNSAVWPTSAFAGVWHMGQSNALDSTAYRNDGIAVGNVTNSVGPIGAAQGVAGGSYVQVADRHSLDFTGNVATVSGWIRYNTLPSNEQPIVRKENQWALENSDNVTKMRSLLNTGNPSGWTVGNDDSFSQALSVGPWYYFAFAYNGENGQLWNFENGVPIGSSPHDIGATINPNNNSLGLGGCSSGYWLADASIAEIRIEKVFRSTNWIWASYMTVASNAGFSVYGSVQTRIVGDNSPSKCIPSPAWMVHYYPGTPSNNYPSLAISVASNGMTVWQDYLAGMNPTDPASRFSVAITNFADQVVVDVASVQTDATNYPGLTRCYDIEQRTNLTGGAWQPAPGCTGIIANGSVVACTNATPNCATFYRIRATLQ